MIPDYSDMMKVTVEVTFVVKAGPVGQMQPKVEAACRDLHGFHSVSGEDCRSLTVQELNRMTDPRQLTLIEAEKETTSGI